ncbi:hypothetical protein FRUB_06559 [Fimbriiglobus ruber]|uniref:Uncharacterized protein n=1 Tax=Fimbriiglobus ruber TaxID=1908690 RepID=A0A225DJS9_9BACT|nr:hypothetical protein FRUB_06559 [Fimbriiglobus ruber]
MGSKASSNRPQANPPAPWAHFSPEGRKQLLAELGAKARRGDPKAAADLDRLLAAYPDLCEVAGTTRTRVEREWADAIGAGDPVAAAAARADAARTRAELSWDGMDGPARLLVDHAVAAHLALTHAELLAAREPSSTVTAVTRFARCQAAFQAAFKGCTRYRATMARVKRAPACPRGDQGGSGRPAAGRTRRAASPRPRGSTAR